MLVSIVLKIKSQFFGSIYRLLQNRQYYTNMYMRLSVAFQCFVVFFFQLESSSLSNVRLKLS